MANINATIKSSQVIDTSIIHIISSADFIGKLIILILIVSSVWSWTIFIMKYIKYNATSNGISKFESIFWSGQVLDYLHEKIKRNTDNPFATIFVSAMNECKKNEVKLASDPDMKTGLKERIMYVMNIVRNKEIFILERSLVFLSTISYVAPFIGLFGTVWGIMHSLQSIANTKNTTLTVVAPGIAEALVTTAIGLFVAIPASIFYNILSNKLNKLYGRMDDFIGELYILLARVIDEEKM